MDQLPLDRRRRVLSDAGRGGLAQGRGGQEDGSHTLPQGALHLRLARLVHRRQGAAARADAHRAAHTQTGRRRAASARHLEERPLRLVLRRDALLPRLPRGQRALRVPRAGAPRARRLRRGRGARAHAALRPHGG
eukprot:scaffold958_cov32-Phaeocystis_antarctica.AAC.1